MIMKTIKDEEVRDTYTIYTFGYGNDHDPKLMQKIANSKGGGFYYIKDLNEVNVAFGDAVGGLMSCVA